MRYDEETTKKAESSSYAGITRIRFKGPGSAIAPYISAGLASSAPVFDCLQALSRRGVRSVPIAVTTILYHPAQLCQYRLKRVGQGALQGQALPCAGVDEGEGPRMEALPRQPRVGLAIDAVTE